MADEPFVPHGDGLSGGLYVTCDLESMVGQILKSGILTVNQFRIARVTLPSFARVWTMPFDKLKVNKLILEEPQALDRVSMFSWRKFIDVDPHLLQWVPAEKQSVSLCRRAIEKDSSTIQYVKDQCNVLVMIALQIDPLCIQYIRRPTCQMWEYAIEHNGLALQHFFLSRIAFSAREFAFSSSKFVAASQAQEQQRLPAAQEQKAKRPVAQETQTLTESQWVTLLFMMAVRIEPAAIEFFYPRAFQFPQDIQDMMCHDAMYPPSTNSKEEAQPYKALLRYIPTSMQTRRMCLDAVEADGMLLEYVTNRTEEIERAAMLQNPRAQKFSLHFPLPS